MNSHEIKAKNVGDHRAAVGFQPGGHAIQRLRFWGSSDIIGLKYRERKFIRTIYLWFASRERRSMKTAPPQRNFHAAASP